MSNEGQASVPEGTPASKGKGAGQTTAEKLVRVLGKQGIQAVILPDEVLPSVATIMRTPFLDTPVAAVLSVMEESGVMMVNVPFSSTPLLSLEQAAELNTQLIIPGAVIVDGKGGASVVRMSAVLGTSINDRRDRVLLAKVVTSAFALLGLIRDQADARWGVKINPLRVVVQKQGDLEASFDAGETAADATDEDLVATKTPAPALEQ